MAAFLSGEMKDTVQMNPAGAYGSHPTLQLGKIMTTRLVVLERFFSRKDRQALFCSWAGSASLWIKVCYIFAQEQSSLTALKGGNAVWGNATHAPDDDHPGAHSHGELIAFRGPDSGSTESTGAIKNNMTVEEAEAWILEHTSSTFQVLLISDDMLNFFLLFNVDDDRHQLFLRP